MINNDLTEILLKLEQTGEYLATISNKLANNVPKGFEWICVHCGYKISLGDNRKLFKKRINIHTDLCVTKLMLETVNRGREITQKVCIKNIKAKDCDIAKLFGCNHCDQYQPIELDNLKKCGKELNKNEVL